MKTKLLLIVGLWALVASAQTDKSVSPSSSAGDDLAAGQKAYRTGKYQAAIDAYNRAIAGNSNPVEAYAGLLRVYLKQEDLQKADDAAAKGSALSPPSTDFQTAMGELYFREGRILEAEQIFVKVINSGAHDARAYMGLAQIRRATSMFKQERELLERAHDFDPSDPDVQKYWMGTLKRTDRIKFLETYLAQESNDDPGEREHLSRYLDLLKDRQQNSRRSCKLVSKLDTTETSLRPLLITASIVQGLGLIVDFNDRSSRLLLDTGASGLVLKKSIAEKAGIVPVIHSHVGGIGDAKDANTYLGYADKIRIGDLEFHDCLVTVTDKAISGTEDGLIGADVFSRYLVDIDFQYQKLRLSPLPKRPTDASPAPASLDTEGDADQKAEEDSATKEKVSDPGPQDRYIAPEMQSYSRVLRFGHILLIPTKISDSSPKLFAIDSGAQMNGISPKVAREVTKVRDDYNSHLKGMSGEVSKVYSADQAVLQFSHFRQENQDVTSWDLSGLSKNLGTEVSGILGFTTLHLFDMKIDYRDGLVDFGFDAKAFKH